MPKIIQRLITVTFFICFSASIAGVQAKKSTEPLGAIKTMLAKAKEAGTKEQFISVFDMAVISFPDDAGAIKVAANGIAPDWIKAPVEVVMAQEGGFMQLLSPALWNAEAEVGAGNTTGNTSERSFTGGLKLKRSFGDWEHSTGLVIDYAKSKVGGDSRTSKDRIYGQYEIFWKGLGEKTFLLNHLEVERDKFSGYDYRLLETVGLGYQLFDSATFKLRVEGGPGYRRSRVDTLASGTSQKFESELLFRGAVIYDWQFAESMKFNNNLGIILSGKSSSMENKMALTAKVNAKLAARLGIDIKYQTSPPLGTKKLDTISRITLVYDF